MNDYIKEKVLSADEVYDRATWMRRPPTSSTSTPHESGNKTKNKEEKLRNNGRAKIVTTIRIQPVKNEIML